MIWISEIKVTRLRDIIINQQYSINLGYVIIDSNNSRLIINSNNLN